MELLFLRDAERHVCAIVSSADWGSRASRNASQLSDDDLRVRAAMESLSTVYSRRRSDRLQNIHDA